MKNGKIFSWYPHTQREGVGGQGVPGQCFTILSHNVHYAQTRANDYNDLRRGTFWASILSDTEQESPPYQIALHSPETGAGAPQHLVDLGIA